MFTITSKENGEIFLAGRLDASQVPTAETVFDRVEKTSYVNFKDLDYISSAGLGVLLKTQKRLSESGQSLILTHMNKLIRDVFHIARFDLVFKIEAEDKNT
jgi:anti-sigma B factor antagonist